MRLLVRLLSVLAALAAVSALATAAVVGWKRHAARAAVLLARARVAQEAADWQGAARLFAEADQAGAGAPARFGAFLARAHVPVPRGTPVRSASDVGFDADGRPVAAVLGPSGTWLLDVEGGALVPWLTEHPRAESASLEEGCLVARARDEAVVLARRGERAVAVHYPLPSDAPFACTPEPGLAFAWRGGLVALSARGTSRLLQPGQGSAVLHVAAGKVFVRTDDGVLSVRDARTGVLLSRRAGIPATYAPSPDAARVVWVDRDGVREGPVAGEGALLVAPRVRASRLSWSADGALVVACGIDPVVRVLDPRAHRLDQTIFGGVSVCAVSAARREVLAGGHLYALPPPEPARAISLQQPPPCLDPAATLCARSRSFVSVEAYRDGTVAARAIDDGRALRPPLAFGSPVRALAIEANGRRAFAATRAAPWLFAIPLGSTRAARPLTVPAAPSALAWDDARRLLAAGFDGGEVLILDDDGAELARLPPSGSPVAALSFSPDGLSLLTGPGQGGAVRETRLPPH